jgi:uncharacterized damage-inducible protein DinB
MARRRRTVDEVELTRAWIDWLVATRPGYLDALLALPRNERRRDRGASFPSLQDIFLHVLNNNVWWFDSVPNDRQQSHQELKGDITAAELRRQVRRVARLSSRLAKGLTPARLNRSLTVRGESGDGKPFEMRMNLRTIIWHMVEEELQHRGEMNALFWQIDRDAPTRAWFSSPLAG